MCTAIKRFLFSGANSSLFLLVAALLLSGSRPPEADPHSPLTYSDAAPSGPITTILLTDRSDTWLELPEPPYKAAVTIKMKLERVGYDVTTDPGHPHDAILTVIYEETPGRYYQRLEQGTHISFDVHLYDPKSHVDRPLLSSHLEADTSWPQPVSSLYWDAVQHLEENPYYYYFGELLQGWLTDRSAASVVFSEVLRRSPIQISTEGEGPSLTAQAAANQGARLRTIAELGRLKNRRALDALLHLVEQSSHFERKAAITAIGKLGDPSALDRLNQLRSTEPDPEVGAALEDAIAQLRQVR